MANFIILIAAAFVYLVQAQDGCDDLRAVYYQVASISQQSGRRSLSVNGTVGTDSPNCTVCRTLQGALGQGSSGNLTVFLSPGIVQLSSPLNVIGMSGLAIIGDSKFPSVIKCAPASSTTGNVSSNVFVSGSNGVYFANITFEGCGKDTSIVELQQSDQVVLDSCIFTNSLAPAVVINNSMTVSFVSCYFSNNQEAIEYPSSIQSTPLMLLIDNSSFVGNYVPGGRGGAIHIDIENSTSSKVCVVRSTFTSNRAAVTGGAVYVSLSNASDIAELYIISSTFINNTCAKSGGAVQIDVHAASFKAINVTGTVFSGNDGASIGGALSIIAWVGRMEQKVSIKKCLFTKNTCQDDGTALGVVSLTGTNELGLPIGVEDCEFSFNSARTVADGASIFLSQSLVAFGGVNNISCNTGGGIKLYGSRMDVQGTVTFFKNYATFGAGAYLAGKSLILLYSGSVLTFNSNKADQSGGGIRAKTISTVSLFAVRNKNCFIQFLNPGPNDIPPSQWNTTVEFSNNRAGLMGAAIHASDFTQCAWLGNSAFVEGQYIFSSINGTASPFILRGNQITKPVNNGIWYESEDLASAAYSLNVSVFNPWSNRRNSTMQVASGEIVSLIVHAYDQFRNKRPAMWTAKLPDNTEQLGSVSAEGGSLSFIVPARNQTNASSISIIVGLNGVEDSASSANNITFLYRTNCHPGYTLNNDSICQCNPDEKIMIRCDDSNRYIYIKPGLWVNYTADNTLYYGKSIPWYLGCTYGNLPGCLFLFDDVDAQCGPNRKGIFCSQCKDGYGVTMDLLSCENNCGISAPGLYIYVILYCILIPILTLVILYFDVKVPNELKGFIFYAQIIGLIYRDSERSTENINAVLSVLYNILGFTTAFPFCLFEGLSPLLVAFLGIVPYILAVLAMVMYLLCANKYRAIGKRKNYGYHGFYFIFLFMYKYFLDFGFILISCKKVSEIGTMHLYTGESCYNVPMVMYFAVGVVIIALLAVGVPIYILHLMYRHKRVIQVSNAISFGLKEGDRYAWYGVWDIWRRIPFVALTTGMIGANNTLFAYAILILLILLVSSIVKPYKDAHVNVIELLIILCLFVVTVIVFRNTDPYVTIYIERSFALAPYFYVLFYIIWRFSSYIGVCNFCKKKLISDKELETDSYIKPSVIQGSIDKQDIMDHGMHTSEYMPLHDIVETMDSDYSNTPREPLLESHVEPRRSK